MPVRLMLKWPGSHSLSQNFLFWTTTVLGETIVDVLLATGCHDRARKSWWCYYQCSCNNNVHLCWRISQHLCDWVLTRNKKCIYGCGMRNVNVTWVLNLRPWRSFYHLDKEFREVFNSSWKPLMMPWGYENETICSGISFHIFLPAIAVILDSDTVFQFNCYNLQSM